MINGGTVGLVVEDFFLFFVPLFFNVETTQCEEEDGSGRDTRTERQTEILSSTRSSSSNVLKSPSCSP